MRTAESSRFLPLPDGKEIKYARIVGAAVRLARTPQDTCGCIGLDIMPRHSTSPEGQVRLCACPVCGLSPPGSLRSPERGIYGSPNVRLREAGAHHKPVDLAPVGSGLLSLSASAGPCVAPYMAPQTSRRVLRVWQRCLLLALQHPFPDAPRRIGEATALFPGRLPRPRVHRLARSRQLEVEHRRDDLVAAHVRCAHSRFPFVDCETIAGLAFPAWTHVVCEGVFRSALLYFVSRYKHSNGRPRWSWARGSNPHGCVLPVLHRVSGTPSFTERNGTIQGPANGRPPAGLREGKLGYQIRRSPPEGESRPTPISPALTAQGNLLPFAFFRMSSRFAAPSRRAVEPPPRVRRFPPAQVNWRRTFASVPRPAGWVHRSATEIAPCVPLQGLVPFGRLRAVLRDSAGVVGAQGRLGSLRTEPSGFNAMAGRLYFGASPRPCHVPEPMVSVILPEWRKAVAIENRRYFVLLNKKQATAGPSKPPSERTNPNGRW